MQLASAFRGRTLSLAWAQGPAPHPSGHRTPVTCMAKKKGIRCIVTLECTESRAQGTPPSRYTTQKNKKNLGGRLELKKYNPFLRRVTLHREIK